MTTAFDLARIGDGLPFGEALGRLEAALVGSATAVVTAPPGTGKTTLAPPVLANLTQLRGTGTVLVTQPRRVAVRAAAQRLAHLDGSVLGDRVGYTVRGDRQSGPGVRVEFVTPGLLIRRLLADPELTGVGAVVLDEVHERQLDTDLLLGLLGDVRDLREDLLLVAMSATLDATTFADLLGEPGAPAPLVDTPSVLHPLEVRYRPAEVPRLDERGVSRRFLAHVARSAHGLQRELVATDATADVLVFVPGVREVNEVSAALLELTTGVEVIGLHGRVEAADQDRAVSGRGPGELPRIIVSTGLAESSLTVPGVRGVVDAGLSREPRRDAARGMSGLVTVASSRATGIQRAGRAARLGPGIALRCFDERTFANAAAHVTPEAATGELTDAALLLSAWGTPRGQGLRFPTPLPAAALDDAERVLRHLEAIDDGGRITSSGRRLASLPVEPRWGRALEVGGALFGMRAAAVVAAATADLRPSGADLGALLRALDGGHHPGVGTWRRDRDRLARLIPAAPTAGMATGEVVGATVAAAWPERLARLVSERTYLLAHGTRAALPHDSPLVGAGWLAIAEVQRSDGREAEGTGAVIRAAVSIEEETALERAGDLLVTEEVADLSSGRMQARRIRRVGAIELASTPVRLDPAAAAPVVARALAEAGLDLLTWSESAQALRRRLAFLHAHVGEPWPVMDAESLARRWQEWLAPEVAQIARGKALAGIELTDPLRRLLPWPAAVDLDALVPPRLPVPSGNTARVRYPEVGAAADAAPVVEVKLQECFGLAESPRILGVPVLFHLLSPAGRPLAVTADLASFWSGPYAGVRAEMRGRYPKHPWPEDPWTAQATSRTNKRSPRP